MAASEPWVVTPEGVKSQRDLLIDWIKDDPADVHCPHCGHVPLAQGPVSNMSYYSCYFDEADGSTCGVHPAFIGCPNCGWGRCEKHLEDLVP